MAQSRQSGTAYLVMDGYWYSIPAAVRNAVYWGFHSAYSFRNNSKYMKLVGVEQNKLPKQINFVDSVVQVYESSTAAQTALKDTVTRELSLAHFNIALPAYFSKQLGTGRSFCYKRILDSVRLNRNKGRTYTSH